MADRIRIEELKLFVGTGLKLWCLDDDMKIYIEHIDIFDERGEIETDEGCCYPIEEIGTNKCKPMVRPLSQLTNEIKRKLSNGFNHLYDQGMLNANPIYFTLSDALILAEGHYDLFGWLDKMDPDGLPLAKVLE